MNHETLTMLLNTVNSILELSDGPDEGFIKIKKHTLSRSHLSGFKENLERELEKFDESGD